MKKFAQLPAIKKVQEYKIVVGSYNKNKRRWYRKDCSRVEAGWYNMPSHWTGE